MFTGIIEATGKINLFSRKPDGAKITVACEKKGFFEDLSEGKSIAVNGVCLTVEKIEKDKFNAFVSKTTLSITDFKINDTVNLEKSLLSNSRLDGHIVTGHIDGSGIISALRKFTDIVEIEITAPVECMKYIVPKGSVAVDGISLTVVSISGNRFKTTIIPHTLNETNLRSAKTGDRVNIELDILAKYCEKIIGARK